VKGVGSGETLIMNLFRSGLIYSVGLGETLVCTERLKLLKAVGSGGRPNLLNY
jgi:hypothetical protein